MPPRKSQEERELEDIIRAQAANTVMWQKQAQAGSEMEKWVADGHYAFIQTRVLAPSNWTVLRRSRVFV